MTEEIDFRLKMRRDGKINPYVSLPQIRMREFCGGSYKRKIEQLTALGIIQVRKSRLGIESYRAKGGKDGHAFCKAYKFSFAIQRNIRAGLVEEIER